MVGKAGKAAVGGCQGEVVNESHYLPPVLEWGMKMDVMVMNEDAMPFRDFLLCDEMNAFRLWMRDEMMKRCFCGFYILLLSVFLCLAAFLLFRHFLDLFFIFLDH